MVRSAISPRGDYMVSVDATKVWRHDLKSGKSTILSHKVNVGKKDSGVPGSAVAFDPSGDMFAVGDKNGVVLLWKTDNDNWGTPISLFQKGVIRALAFDPQSQVLAAGNEYGKITVWEASTGKRVSPTLIGDVGM